MITKCYLKDIKEFEETHNMNILRLFEHFSISNLILLFSVFYKNISDEDICNIIDDLFRQGYSVDKIFYDLRDILLGYKVEDNEIEDEEQVEIEDKTGTYEDIRQYDKLSDFYMHLCMQMLSLGMSYSEFWSLTTADMYKAFEAIQQKMVYDYNRQMQGYHMLAGLIGGGVWGKLPKEAPHIDLESLHDPDEEIDTPLGRMTREDYKNAVALNKVFAANDAKYSNGGLDNG